MNALSAIKGLFGRSGYRTYASALGRVHTTFHANVSDPTTTTSRLVATSCRLLQQARENGENPLRLLLMSAGTHYPDLPGQSGLRVALEAYLGDGALDKLATAMGMSSKALDHAISCPEARYNPHFRLIAVTLAALVRHGVSPDLTPPEIEDRPTAQVA